MRRVERPGQGAHIHSFCQCNHSRSGMRFWLTKVLCLPQTPSVFEVREWLRVSGSAKGILAGAPDAIFVS